MFSKKKLGFLTLALIRSIYHNLSINLSINKNLIEPLVAMLVKNKMHIIAYDFIKSMNTFEENIFQNILKSYVEKNLALAKYRNELIAVAVETFNNFRIPYVIFKTFNPKKVIETDVDILIPKQYFHKAIKELLRKRFKLIDDIKKTYAIGLIINKNPIILDLHTDLTVGGISYLKPKLMFDYVIKKEMENINENITINLLDNQIEFIVRILHAFIKEAELSLGDMYDISMLLRNSNIYSILNRSEFKNIKELILIGLRISNSILNEKFFSDVLNEPIDNSWNFLQKEISTKILEGELPVRLKTFTHIRTISKIIKDAYGSRGFLYFAKNIIIYKRNLKHSINKLLSNIYI